MTEDIQILRYMQNINFWWENDIVPSRLLQHFHRRDFYQIRKRLYDKEILSITGSRRVGKTTLIYQLIHDLLLNQGILPTNILYLTLDDPLWYFYDDSIKKAIELYGDVILKRELSQLTVKDDVPLIFVFIDEIHNQQNWEFVLKSYYDQNFPIKFIISGSSRMQLVSKSTEALVGRISHFNIFPFNFLETCRFHYEKTKGITELEELDEYNRAFQRNFKSSIRTRSPQPILTFLEEKRSFWTGKGKKWKILFDDYLLRGGYPETLSYELIRAREYLKMYIELILHRDIQRFIKIRQIDRFKQLFMWIANESSQRTSLTNLSKILGLKQETLQHYLQALESAYLIKRAPYFSKSVSKRVRRPSKFYVTDVGIQAAYMNFPFHIHQYNSTDIGKVVETLVFNHLLQFKTLIEIGLSTDVEYWQDSETDKEVDLIFELFQTPIPIEVKYRSKITKDDCFGLKRFLSLHANSPYGILISKDKFSYDSKDRIFILPIWLFLTAL